MWGTCVRHTLYGAGCRGRNRVLFRDRRNGRNGWLRGIQVPPNLYVEPFTLKFEVSQRVFIDQADQFAQLVHVNGSFQMLRQRTMPAPAAIALALSPRIGRWFV